MYIYIQLKILIYNPYSSIEVNLSDSITYEI
jgi:hypothetical protein